MAASKLDRRIEIFRPHPTKQPNGEYESVDQPLEEIWAQLMEQRVGEVFSGGADVDRMKRVFRIRVTDIKRTDKVKYSGDMHEVVAIREHGRNNKLDVECEVLPHG